MLCHSSIYLPLSCSQESIIDPIPPFVVVYLYTLRGRKIITHLLAIICQVIHRLCISHHHSLLALIMLFGINLGPPLGSRPLDIISLIINRASTVLYHHVLYIMMNQGLLLISYILSYNWHCWMFILVYYHLVPFMTPNEDITTWVITTSGCLFLIALDLTIGCDYHGF